jgi:adenylate cyclase
VLFTPDDLSECFGTGTNTSFIVTNSGDVLLHPDSDLILGGANFSSLPIVATMQQEGDSNRRQISFTDDSGINYFGAYYRIAGTDTTAITTIPHDIVFEAVQSITRQNLFLTAAVLALAILFVWFFSKTISKPVRTLADAALRIEGGDFEVELEPKSHDELGLLTESFGKMSSALNIFGRFTNKDIAVRAMRGEIKPGGLSKHGTMFFSDIRGFTEKSENFTMAFGDEASNRIVMWLNEYFTRMVDCVEKTGGVVDKFIGDAVMAHWGTAFTAGSPEEDAFNCVKATLMMRAALGELNATRAKNDPGNAEIRIGCGINSGIVTAGQIGSDQRMEYTVIGDPVNLASRTEALNKPFGTDILITEDTWEVVGDKFITEEMPAVTVKGKEKPVRIFAVVNMVNVAGPKTLAEVRTLLGIPTPDLDKVETDEEEKKYKIQGN